MSWLKYWTLGLLLVAPAAAFAQEETQAEKKMEPPQAKVPIKQVVMYSSGVAFFERRGQVEGDAELDLQFNVKEINDLLKSMILQDLGGGRISTITYEARDPISRTLRTFAIDLTEAPGLGELLAQIRGEEIAIDAVGKEIVGQVISVETKEVPVDGRDDVREVQYVTLLTETGIRRVSLENVGAVRILDEELNDELKKALTTLATSLSTDKKSVTLKFAGEGARNVRVGYIQEAPIWKTSYRLVLDQEDKPFLQGWAIVENTTEADWENVDLTLVSGRPISFVMDLYGPLFVDRPVVEPELYASLRPQTYGQDLDARDRERVAAAAGKGFGQLAMSDEAAEYRQQSNRGLARRKSLQEEQLKELKKAEGWSLGDSVQTAAQASELGELFRYTIAQPVTLPRGRSAMLPIVNDSVEGELLSIYNPGVHAKHPLAGLRLKNATELHLMQGPITVYQDGAYAGDARIEDISPGAERLISYAMDLDMEVAQTVKGQTEELVGVKVVRGTLYATRKYTKRTEYVAKSSAGEATTLLIEQPIDSSWDLSAPEAADEKTRDLYRFRVKVDSGATEKLTVVETRQATESIGLSNVSDNTILLYVRSNQVGEELKEALKQVLEQKQEIAKVAQQRKELERQISVIQEEQDRIRQNMAALQKDSDLYRRYIEKFSKQEDEIETLREQVTTLTEKEQQLREQLNAYLQGLSLS